MTAIGAYVGTTPSTLGGYTSWLGRGLDDVLVSINQTGWDAFDSSIAWDVDQWKPTGTSIIWSVPLTVTGTALEQTATGAYDAHYLKAAQALVASEPTSGPIYVRVGWEFNISGGQPWAAEGHEQAFIQSFQNLVNTFRGVSDRFKFVWDPNIGGAYNPALAYPGDDYVDVIGADMYYNAQWDGDDTAAAFATKASEPYGLQWQQDFAAAHHKPTAVSEWGVNTDNAGPYIQAAGQWFSSHNMIYENYWESNAAYSGQLHGGAYPDAGRAFIQTFGVPPAATSTIPTVTGFVDTSGLEGSGSVVVDLPGGFVSKAGTVEINLSSVSQVQLGADTSIAYGLKAGTDKIQGRTGAFSLYGQGAADTIQAGSGNATIMGGSGQETFVSGGGTNVMYGGTSTNYMLGGTAATSNDTFYGKGGKDTVTGAGGSVTLFGSSGTEVLNGGGGVNTLYGGSGTNTLTGLMTADAAGRVGTNILYGGTGASAGVDLFYAGAGTNSLYEGSGVDYFASNAGTNYIYGGAGKSFVYGGTGTQSIFTGAGNQYIQAGGGNTLLYETPGTMKAGRFDQIDGFNGGRATDIFLPAGTRQATTFVSQNGGTAVLTAVGQGYAEVFVSGASVFQVQSHTHFTL